MSKKILILTMTCGEGHNAIAKSLKNFLEHENEVKVVDIFEHDKKLQDFNNKGYLFLCKYLGKPYDFVWNKLRKRNPEKRFKGAPYNSIKKSVPYIKDIVLSYNPDIIISTHCYASNIVSILKRDNIYTNKSYGILTDYVDCPNWEASVLNDKIFTPHELTHNYLIARGFREEQFVVSGYPINNLYEQEKNKEDLQKKHGIDKNTFVVLVMNGGYGISNPIKLIKTILKSKITTINHKILCLCGRNKKIKQKVDKYIKKYNLKNVVAFEFINYVDELMSISDVIFCRGGANTISEAIRKHVVPIIREKVVCNEIINKNIFMQNNIALGMNKLSDAKKCLNYCIENPDKLKEMKKNMQKFYKKNATEFIANYITNN